MDARYSLAMKDSSAQKSYSNQDLLVMNLKEYTSMYMTLFLSAIMMYAKICSKTSFYQEDQRFSREWERDSGKKFIS